MLFRNCLKSCWLHTMPWPRQVQQRSNHSLCLVSGLLYWRWNQQNLPHQPFLGYSGHNCCNGWLDIHGFTNSTIVDYNVSCSVMPLTFQQNLYCLYFLQPSLGHYLNLMTNDHRQGFRKKTIAMNPAVNKHFQQSVFGETQHVRIILNVRNMFCTGLPI